MESSLPVWLQTSFSNLVSVAEDNRLPHGMLLVGRKGDGASILSKALSEYLLCSNRSKRACGQCKSCQLSQSGSHPDFLKIEPDGKSMTIKIDAIRRVTEKISETAQQGGCKVVYLQSAERMNINAANALLKVLEEPTSNTFILLETAELSQALPTIRSRCRIIHLARPSLEQAQHYLVEHGFQGNADIALSITANAPVDALSVTQEAIDFWLEVEQKFIKNQSFMLFSQFIAKQDLPELFEQILLWVDTAVKQQKGQKSLAPVSDRLIQSLQSISTTTLFHFRDYIVGILSAFQRHANLNNQLLAEELASKWIELRGQNEP